ncbi:hypothetical protein C5167_021806 [Papaver somniferum]|uniref:FAD-binding PCMH-type domain-containing protein n=1 Tax=Papaver somniferum TaxID=3469 RepID=A0A4Y7JHN4_PAPSO|nr:berberine bridge enzyme-like 22 [Papaver somniferum]RZC60046.1 hypothetical protein C5167_021806 [Papaver somniferum]
MHPILGVLSTLLALLLSSREVTATESSFTSVGEDFLQCLNVNHVPNTPTIPIYTQNNASYRIILRFSNRNFRFLSTTKPKFIVTPTHESHVQASVVWCKKHGLDLKIRSGGHDAEGLSYVSDAQSFVIVDLIYFRNVTVDVNGSTAWIQAGATLGEVYYNIAKKSKTHGFPAGFAPTVGVGGHIGGGGLGALVRKYGLAADRVIDAYIVNADGKILNKKSMTEGLFWAIRGGGAASFGVVLSWKVKLVRIPATVTVAMVQKTLGQGATDTVHKWQFIADRLNKDVFIGVKISLVGNNKTNLGDERIVQAEFSILFLGKGGIPKLLQLSQENFPELGLKNKDCSEMTWAESHLYFSHEHGKPLEFLLARDDPSTENFSKSKSDHVKVPITKNGLLELWRRLLEHDDITPTLIWTPYGGKMNEISVSEIPFPHRQGNIYNILYVVSWFEDGESEKNLDWMRNLYEYMTPYVSKSPRTAYLNTRDLDLGEYDNGQSISYLKAREWGRKYFKDNFERLVQVKSEVDPGNFFNNKQSIPPIRVIDLGVKNYCSI